MRWWLAGLCLLAGCGPATSRVEAGDHDAFFLWAGVRPSPPLERARTVYILSGEVRAGDAQLVPLRPGVPKVPQADLWLTVRAERLDWEESVFSRILSELARWKAAGNRVVGLQIDFDARTRGLEQYARFLAEVRRRLPQRYRLSVTGLMDWSSGGDPAALNGLAGTVDEVVVQTYQGRRTIEGYQRYMAALMRLPLPYRVGLVEGGEWHPPPGLETDPEFRGYVVFLLTPSGRR